MTGDPDDAYSDVLLVLRYPWIPWTEPVRIGVPGVGRRWACRLCIAALGLTAEGAATLPTTREEVEQHVRADHPRLLIAE